MTETFEQNWEQHAKCATELTNFLLQPPPKQFIDLLFSAKQIPSLANYVANAFEYPSSLFSWIYSSEETNKKIENLKNLDSMLNKQLEQV